MGAHRDPESYVAGATPLNRNAPRYSGDIDIFQDREERVAPAALNDPRLIKAEGYRVTWLRQLPLIQHPADLAVNKVMAAAGRRELRDIVDLVTIHETIMPLGAVIWAAVEKSPGFTPEGQIAEIRRNLHYPAAEWRALQSSQPLNPKDGPLSRSPRRGRSLCGSNAHRQTRPALSGGWSSRPTRS